MKEQQKEYIKMNYQPIMFVAITMAFFAGCVPGEAGFLIKTSALSKVMRGEQAEIMAGVKDVFVISNANDKVSIALKGIETKRDFVCVLTNLYSRMFVGRMFGESVCESGERDMSFVMEERTNDWPILKMEATFPASLTRKRTGPEDPRKGGVERMPTILCLGYDPENGYLEYSESTISNNSTYAEYYGRITGACSMLATLKSINNDEKVDRLPNYRLFSNNSVLDRMAKAPLCAFCMTNVSFFVEGDDDKPIFVIGKNVKVNGKPVADYQAWIRKGDKVCITWIYEEFSPLDKKDNPLERVRFFESEAQAKAVKDVENRIKQSAYNNVK